MHPATSQGAGPSSAKPAIASLKSELFEHRTIIANSSLMQSASPAEHDEMSPLANDDYKKAKTVSMQGRNHRQHMILNKGLCNVSFVHVKSYHIMNIHYQFVVINTTQLSLFVCLSALYVFFIFMHLVTFHFLFL